MIEVVRGERASISLVDRDTEALYRNQLAER